MVSVQNLYKTYPGPTHALANVTFELRSGEVTYLIGHSGAGKTTLFNLINGFDSPSSGAIYLNRVNINEVTHHESVKLRQNIGVIFQDFRLLEHKNVFDNILVPLIIRNYQQKIAHAKVKALASDLKLSHVLDKLPNQISGGEKQRAAIARAIIHDPDIIFADEPTGSLDPENGRNIFRILHKLASMGKTVFVATHNLDLISEFPGRVLNLKQGQLTC